MKTAKEFAQAAAQMANLAVLMKPADDADTYATTQKLIQYHLQAAAANTRAIAEALAEQERSAPK